MVEKQTPYNGLLQVVAEAQEKKGEGGCFAEIYKRVKSLGGIAYIYGDRKTLESLSQLVEGLPDNQTDEAVTLAQNGLDTITKELIA